MMPYSQLEPKVNEFPRRRFLGLAGFQVAVGLLFIVLGFVDLGVTINDTINCNSARYYGPLDYEDDYIDMPEMREQNSGDFMKGTPFPPMNMDDRHPGPPPMDMDDRPPRPPPMDMEDRRPLMFQEHFQCPMEQYYVSFACAPIWCGVMFIIAGALGLGAARTPLAHRKSGLKIGFMVLCVINVLGFIPLTLGGGIAELIMNLYGEYGSGNDMFRVVAGGIYATLSMVLLVVAIVSAGVACCCAPVEEVKVVYVPQYFQAQQPSVADTKAVDVGDLSGKTQHI